MGVGEGFRRAGDSLSDFAGPVGSSSAWHHCSARRVLWDSAGNLVFGEEAPIFYGHPERSWSEIETNGRIWPDFHRFEVKAKSPREGAIRPGDEIVIAHHPYFLTRVVSAEFKRSCHGGTYDRPAVDALTADDALVSLRKLTEDPWESGSYLTAAPETPVARPLDTFEAHGIPNAEWDYIFGVCESFERAERSLRDDKRGHELIERVRSGRIRFKRPERASTGWVTTEFQPSDYALDSASDVLISVAIPQALAGPVHEDDDVKEVWTLVERLFFNHLNTLTKHSGRRESGREVHFDELPARTAAAMGLEQKKRDDDK
jgi:hypothetical protein